MPQFQLRYPGPDGPEPETVIAADTAEALAIAHRRRRENRAAAVTLAFDGVIISILKRPASAAPGFADPETDRAFAAAGVYAFTSQRDQTSEG
jgi:hypothetical protein